MIGVSVLCFNAVASQAGPYRSDRCRHVVRLHLPITRNGGNQLRPMSRISCSLAVLLSVCNTRFIPPSLFLGSSLLLAVASAEASSARGCVNPQYPILLRTRRRIRTTSVAVAPPQLKWCNGAKGI